MSGQTETDTHLHNKRKLTSRYLAMTVRPALGLLFSLFAAFVWSKLFSGSEIRQYAPVFFVVLLLVVAAKCGLFVSVLGGLLAALVFCYFLYPPLGSLRVAESSARQGISWMLLTALVISFLLFPPKGRIGR